MDNPNVIHNVYPEGLPVPEHMMNPNIGGYHGKKNLLQTSGSPRTGNSYLNQALNLLYYPEDTVNVNRHDIDQLSMPGITIVPFRNPLDTTASDYLYPYYAEMNLGQEPTVEGVIKEYCDFYEAVLNNLDKVCLMDFDQFTTSIDYIKSKIFQKFKINSNNQVTDEDVKKALLSGEHVHGYQESSDSPHIWRKADRSINLPRGNKEDMDRVKAIISKHKDFDRCLDIYNRLKIAEDEY